MPSRFILLIQLLAFTPMLGNATVIASAYVENCGTRATEAEFETTASLACVGANVTASASLWELSASGTSGESGAQARGTASFELPLLVVGTDQSGFIRYSYWWTRSMHIVSSRQVQTASIRIGDTYVWSNWIGPCCSIVGYIPYSTGIPVILSGEVRGLAGNSSESQFGAFFVIAHLSSLRAVATTGTDGPPLPGSSVVIVPEPSNATLVLLGLGGFLAALGTRRGLQ